MRINNIFFYLSLFLLSQACMVGPKYKQPDVAKGVTMFQEDIQDSIIKDSVRATDWFRLFEDATLVGYIDSALKNNLDLTKAVARIEEARALYGFNKADLLPSFTYGASYQRFDFSNNVTDLSKDPIQQFRMNAGVTWEIDLWGKLRHNRNAAMYEMKGYVENANAIRLSLITEVAGTYFKLLDLDTRLRVIEATIKSRQDYFDIIHNKFSYGEVSELDKLQSEQQLEQVIILKYQYIRSIKETERALTTLLGIPPGEIQRGKLLSEQTINVFIPDSLPASLLQSRPDMRAFENKMIAQNERVGVAVAMRYPSFQITGLLGFASADVSSLISSQSVTNSITAGLFGPLYNFGKNKRRVEMEKHRLTQYQAEYQKLYLVALTDVANSLTYTKTFKEEMQHRQILLEAARKTLMLSRVRYDNGYTSYLEVLINEQNLLSAELEYSILQRSYLNSFLEVYKAFGGGW